LIAYNVNLNTASAKVAKSVAWRIRDSLGPVRNADHTLERDADGTLVRRPGRFAHCKATGWYIAEYGRAQVTMNLTDYEQTPIHAVFDECRRLARELGARVTGSEIVGVVPRAALTAAGAHYLAAQRLSPGAPAADLVDAAICSLGLDDVAPFDRSRKIVEEALRDPSALVARSVADFADRTSAATAVPGGGSVAALSGALSASLLAMVANLSVTARGFADRREELSELATRAQALKEELLAAVDLDAAAYEGVLRAARLPRSSEAEAETRQRAIAAANRAAAAVPFSVLERTITLLELAHHLVDAGMEASLSDAAVAAAEAAAAADGACFNVLTNLASLEGTPVDASALDTKRRALELGQRAHRLADDLRAIVLGRLSG
jgi:glutamate formiminotransferase/formiminotetrahydrofolate cyclodeaminase